ncbi:MAG: SpoIVB peptidase [Clostridia bacterium]|nr:SpoIVB peptidase [Oscillospiraceae bacterium]MBQ7005041.1 SpoIVB peptidase [Clostridia bacterium]
MKKSVKALCLLFMTVTVFLMSAVVYGFYAVPDDVSFMSDEEIYLGRFFSCDIKEREKSVSKSLVAEGEYRLNLKLLGKIPVKNFNLKINSRPYLVPSGDIIGLRIFTEGVMIVGTESVETAKGTVAPSKQAHLEKGDVIISLDGKNVTSSAEVESVIKESGGKALEVSYKRNGEIRTTVLTPVMSVSEGTYKTGLWIRDSAAGIGTMTFYDRESGFFASLGHAVCDVDTGEILPLSDGDIVDATINGCVKGRMGSAGELCGSFKSECEGSLVLNCENGVFGYLENADKTAEALPVAAESEIKEGKAQIISTVEGESKAYYDVEIEKLNRDGQDGKNMIIKITDSKLIEKTGGIVQGMSGSPVLQNGYIVGAVTHVFINDPTKGYGIFAETMLDAAG